MKNKKIIYLSWGALSAYLIYLASKLAWFNSLSSLANDSVNYLVMARHYSPWVVPQEAIESIWAIQDFPPLFPWLLAMTGTAHSLLAAHILTTALGFSCLYLFYRLSARWLGDNTKALLPVLVFALAPGFILGIQGILSEPLYLLLVLGFLLAYNPDEEYSYKKLIFLSLLLASIMLTRTIGFSLLLALGAQGVISSISKNKIQLQALILAVIPIGAYALLMLWGPDKESHYFNIILQLIDSTRTGENGNIWEIVSPQFSSLQESWSSFWIIYWTKNFSVSHTIILILLLMSLLGLFTRLIQNKYDSWYVLFYLLILLVWPHPGQMVRLLLPIMPLLLLYAVITISKYFTGSSAYKIKIPSILLLITLAAILPSHAFIHNRIKMADEHKMIPVYEIFRYSDLTQARYELLLQNKLFEDFEEIQKVIPNNESSLYFMPEYLAILSNVRSVRSPSPIIKEDYQRISQDSGSNFIFITQLHPRKTRKGYSGLQGAEKLSGWTRLVWCSEYAERKTSSCLYKIIDAKVRMQ